MPTALITTAEQSKGAQAFTQALQHHGWTTTYATLTEETHTPHNTDLKIDRSLPPYDLPITNWHTRDPHTPWWNRPDHAWAAWSKTHTMQQAAKHSIPHIPTLAFDHLTPEDHDEGTIPEHTRTAEIYNLLGPNIVLKPDRRSVGNGLTLTTNPTELSRAMQHLRSGIAQPYLPEGRNTLRIVIAAQTIIAAYTRHAPKDDWRANVGRGATTTKTDITPQTQAIALKTVETLQLDFAGIDIIETDNGPLLLEANPAFGITGLQHITNGQGVHHVIETLLATLP